MTAPVVSLREITAETVRTICELEPHEAQSGFVAPNAVSIAQAYFEPAAWFRAIHDGDVPVGFVMLYDPRRAVAPRDPDVAFLWRFMVDAAHQGRGVGSRALDLVVAHARTLPGVARLRVSYVDAPGHPAPFYAGAGFVPTGAIEDGEVVMERSLHDA